MANNNTKYSLDIIDNNVYLEFFPEKAIIEEKQGNTENPTYRKTSVSLPSGLTSIRMPVPQTLSDNLSIKYETQELLSKGIESLGSKSIVGGLNIKSTSSVVGANYIPQSWKNWQGLDDSTWPFTWDFIFKSRESALKLFEIIHIFRSLGSGKDNISASSSVTGGIENGLSKALGSNAVIGTGGFTKGVPTTWRINLKFDIIQKVIVFPKELVLTSVTTDFGGSNGIDIFKAGGGPPTQCTLKLVFENAKTLTPDDLIYSNNVDEKVNSKKD